MLMQRVFSGLAIVFAEAMEDTVQANPLPEDREYCSVLHAFSGNLC